MLQKYFETVLDSWNAVQFAVQQQTGGPQSHAISKWMNQVTVQFFHDNKDLEPEEVADFLNSLMDQEFNTLVEDGSDLEVSTILCRIYDYDRAGNTSAIQGILAQIPRANKAQAYSVKSDSDDEMEACQQVSSQMTSLSLSSAGPPPSASEALTTKPSSEEQHLDEEEDGWTVIKKGKRKTR